MTRRPTHPGKRGIRLRRANKLSDKDVQAICNHVSEDHLTLQQACHLVGADPVDFARSISGPEPTYPTWGAMWLRAQAKSIKFWIEEGKRLGEAKNTAGVKFCELMLKAQDKLRFREESKVGPQAPMTVMFLTGKADFPAVKTLEAEVAPPTIEVEAKLITSKDS